MRLMMVLEERLMRVKTAKGIIKGGRKEENEVFC